MPVQRASRLLQPNVFATRALPVRHYPSTGNRSFRLNRGVRCCIGETEQQTQLQVKFGALFWLIHCADRAKFHEHVRNSATGKTVAPENYRTDAMFLERCIRCFADVGYRAIPFDAETKTVFRIARSR